MRGIIEYINDDVILRDIVCEAKVMFDRIPMSLQEYCSDEKNLSEGPEDITTLNGFKEPREGGEAFVIATQNFKSGLDYVKKNIGKDDYKNAFIVLPFDNCNVVVTIDFRKGDIHNAGIHIVGPKDVNIKSVISISRSAFEFYKDLYAKEEDLNDKLFKALGELQKKSEDKFSVENQEDTKMPSPDKSPYTLSKKKRFPEYIKHATVKANGKDFIYKNTWNGEAEIFVQTVQKNGKKYYKVLMGDVDSSFENGRDLTDVYYLTTLGQLDKFLEFTLKPARRKQHAELGADGEIHRWSSAMNKTLPASLKKDIIKDEQLINDLDFKYFDIYDLYK